MSATRKRQVSNSASYAVKWSPYIYRVLKRIYPELGISMRAMNQLESIIGFIGFQLMKNVNHLLRISRKSTITSREIQFASSLLLKGQSELYKLAISNATGAVTKYNASAGSATDKGRAKKGAPTSSKAGLQFSVSRAARYIRMFGCLPSSKGGKIRVGVGAPIYLAAVFEYLISEIIESAGQLTKDYFKKQRITDRHILLAIRRDQELDQLFAQNRIYLTGGVVPYELKLYTKEQMRVMSKEALTESKWKIPR